MRPHEISEVTCTERHSSKPSVRRRLFSDNCEQKVIVEYINHSPPLPVEFVMNLDSDDTVYCDVITDDISDEDIERCLDAEEDNITRCHFFENNTSKESSPHTKSSEKSIDWDSVNGSQETYSEFNGLHDYCINPNKRMEYSTSSASEDDNEVESLDWLLDFSLDSILELGTKPNEVRNQNQASQDCRQRTPWQPTQYVCKPPYNYGELIQLALKEKGQLTVDDIYNWIRIKFPYYRFQEDKRWKAGIRHKLSTHSAFVKTSKSTTKRGHLWSYVVKENTDNNKLPVNKNHWKKQKIADYKKDIKQECTEVCSSSNPSKSAKTPKTRMCEGGMVAFTPKVATQAPATILADEISAQNHSGQPAARLQNGICGDKYRIVSSQNGSSSVPSASSAIPQTLNVLQVSPNQLSRVLQGKQNNITYIVSNTVLNPVSPGQVMKESGLMDDPLSANTIMPFPSYNINPANMDASQELFGGALKVHQCSNAPTMAS